MVNFDGDGSMKVTRLTPVLVVDEIVPCLPFWVDRLGFAKTAEVSHEGHLGFVILERDEIQIMYQSRASVAADLPPLARAPSKGAFLYLVVDDLDAVETALEGIKLVLPRRSTFYGADELIVNEPGGNVVTFAQFAATQG